MTDFDHCCYVLILLEHTNVEDECRLSVSTKKVGEEATEFARLSQKPHAKVSTIT